MTRQSPSVPVSYATLVPLVGALLLSIGLWRGPQQASAVTPLLPFLAELCLFWLPFGSLCFWFAARRVAQKKRTRAEGVRDSLVAVSGALAASGYVLAIRLPAWRGAWPPNRFVTELFALASTTWHGLPLVALAGVLGWAAASTVLACALGDLMSLTVGRARARRLRAVLGLGLFAVGSSAVLRYATGSPWPLIH
jgi:hypothetical protein